MTNKKSEVEKYLSNILLANHWRRQSICELPSAFCRNIDVSPVFMPNVIRRKVGSSIVDGYVGVVCQPFERLWLSKKKPNLTNRYCMMTNIANISQLLNHSSVDDNSIEEGVQTFSSQLSMLLEALPHDLISLEHVFRQNEMAGMPLSEFVLYGQEEKFSMLKDFINSQFPNSPNSRGAIHN
jgi:hypothetical protein